MSNFLKKEEKLVPEENLVPEGKASPGSLFGSGQNKRILTHLNDFVFIFEPRHIHFLTQVADALPIRRHRTWNTV